MVFYLGIPYNYAFRIPDLPLPDDDDDVCPHCIVGSPDFDGIIDQPTCTCFTPEFFWSLRSIVERRRRELCWFHNCRRREERRLRQERQWLQEN